MRKNSGNLATIDGTASTEPVLMYLSQCTSYCTWWICSFFHCQDCLTQSLPSHVANLAATMAKSGTSDTHWATLLTLSRLLHTCSYPSTSATILYFFKWICVWKPTCIFIVWSMYLSASNLHFPQMKLVSEKPPEAVSEEVIFKIFLGGTPLDHPN